jgi:hypothetical protein
VQRPFPIGDHWFTFGPRNYDSDAGIAQPDDHYASIAADVARLIESQAETWWESFVPRSWWRRMPDP